jgi:hypothetical protein
LWEAVFVAADAGEFFHVGVPRREVVVADRPWGSEVIAGWTFEFKWRPALCLSRPEKAFAADLIAPDPVERLFLDIRMCFIGYEEMFCGFAVGVAAAEDGVVVEDGVGQAAAVREFPGRFGGGGIVFEMFHVPTAFEEEGFQAFAAEFFGGPAAADAGADDDGVVVIHITAFVLVGS